MFKYSENIARCTRTFCTHYSNGKLKITQVNSCLKSGFELIDKIKVERTKKDNLERTFRRIKATIKDLALENNFEYFCTFTVKPSIEWNRYELEDVQNNLRKLLKSYKRKYKDFAYIIITEEHKDGAYHFHGLVKNLYDLYQNEYSYLSSNHFDTLGFNSFSKIQNYEKCCNYILKYISKDMVRLLNNKFYIRSRNLLTPSHYEIENLSIENWDYENDYCKMSTVDLKNVDLETFHNLSKLIIDK